VTSVSFHTAKNSLNNTSSNSSQNFNNDRNLYKDKNFRADSIPSSVAYNSSYSPRYDRTASKYTPGNFRPNQNKSFASASHANNSYTNNKKFTLQHRNKFSHNTPKSQSSSANVILSSNSLSCDRIGPRGFDLSKFSVVESPSDGVDSGEPNINPSKSSLIFIYALVNKHRIKLLIDTGATKTFINSQILHHLVPKSSILKRSYSFLLADGIASFNVLGLVDLSIEFNNFVTPITAHIAQHLCTDMIIGMDFINRYNLSIDVKKQLVCIEVRNQRILVPIVNVMKSIKIPVISSNTILLPSNSTRKISVAIPISSISLQFIPNFSFKSHIPVDHKDNTLTFHNYRSDVLLYNAMRRPKVIKKGTRLGYLLCCSTFQHPRMFYSSHYRLHGTTRCTGMNPAFSNSIIKDDFHIGSSALSNNNSTCTNRFILYSADKLSSSKKVYNSTVTQHLNLLVQNVQNDEHKRDLLALLRQFSNMFDTTRHNVANTPIPHVINTIPHSPPASRPYPQPDKEEIMYQFIQEFLQAGLISESNSPYAAPAMLIKKKDNSYRFVVDYKRLNAITIKDSFPLPNMEDTIFKLGKGFSYFSKFDLKSGFYQIPINEADKMKTAFITPFGLYQFNVLPMGLRNSPPTFQKVMTDTLKSCRSFCLVYLDDIIVFSESFSDHLYHLRCVFSALHDKNLLLNPPKCELAVQRINYLGHTISKDSITPMKDKIEAILRIPEPHTLAQANRFLGSLGWYRKFLPKFADVAAPIHAVTNLTKPNRKNFKWETAQSKAFHQLKHMLITEPLFLHFPVDKSPLILTTDASDTGLGGVLQQTVNGQLHNLYYHSQIMTPCQRKYSTIEKEALAIYRCFDRMHSFILGRTIIIMTDHCPLCYIMKKTIKNARVNRITHLIQEYNIDKVVHIRGQYNCLPDYLSRYSKEQFDDLFDIEYGLASKTLSTLSSSAPNNDTNNITSDSLVSSTNQKLLAAMTLRPRKNRLNYAEESISRDSDIHNHHDSTDTSNSTFNRKSKVTSKFSQNYFDVAKLQFEQDRD
ncbi:unnamed protein product, partial [Rotaria socialis]